MDSDTSDILGGPTSLNARESQSGWWKSLPFGAKSVFTLIVLFILYVVGSRVREIFLVWREKAHKLAMRRRHGIPDNDHRPFNVAYAAVLRARQEDEEKARRVRLQEMVQDAPPDQDLRQRNGFLRGVATGSSNSFPGRYESVNVISSTYGRAGGSNHSRPTFTSRSGTEEYYNPNPAVRIADPEIDNSPTQSRLSRRAAKYIGDQGRRHGPKGGDESDYTRKARLNDENGLCGDEESEWIEEHGSPRGWKRGHGYDHDDEDNDSIHVRDKRQRKVSLDKSHQVINENEDMDIDEEEDEDEVDALRSFSRGKKRDRAEAGSTFGGDDEDDSDRETEQVRRRHRKRRTYAKRKSDSGVSSRGTKRDRELAEDDNEDDNEDDTSIRARKKRGKKAAHVPQQDDQSDVSMDESQASSSRGRPKRSIGEEWESNGVKYKIGPNGQRLRQTLVRKERQKFPMPEDSQHPDRQANFEVYVETWLTEEEYREAKDHQLLAWQDSSKPSAEPQTPTIESPEEVLPVAGKDLLWNSTSGSSQPAMSTSRQITPPVTPQAKQRNNDLFGSLSSNSGIRANPFVNPPPAGKRVSSAVRRPSALKLDGTSTVPPSPAGSIVHSLSDSTNNSPRHKAFSKWEKQDLEAKAMMKMRQANRLKEEERLEKLKKEQEAAVTASKAIPTITVTKADDAKPTETKQPAFSFAPAPASDAIKKDTPNSLFPAGPAKGPTQPPLFAPPTSQPTTKPPTTPIPASTVGSQPAKPASGLSGSKPEHLNSFVSFGPSPSAPTSTSTPPATSIPTSVPANPGIPTSKPAFSFGPHPQPNQAAQEGKKSDTASGGSLLSRLSPSASAPATQSTQPSQVPSAFGFSKPSEVPKSTSAFGDPSTTQPSSQPAPAQPATASTGPKFDFGFGKGPTGGTTTATTSGSSTSRPAASPFAFTPSNTTDSSTAVPSTAGSTTAPKFSFPVPSSSSSSSGSNSFAPKSSATSGTSTTATNGIASTSTTTAPPQSVFSFGNKPAGETSTPVASPFGAFGNNPVAASTTATTPAHSPFEAFGAKPDGASTIRPAQSVFGTQPATPSSTTAPAQSAFAFGTKSASTSSTQPAFGAQPMAGTSAPAPVQSPFATGSSSTSSTSSVFGASNAFGSKSNGTALAPAQSAFSGGFGGLNGASTSSPFGATAGFGGRPTTVTSSAPPAAPKENASKPIFSFGKTPAASSSTTPLMTPSATPTPSTTAATSGAPSTFGTSAFGSSLSSTFTFGGAGKNSTTPQTSQTTASPFGKPADINAFGFGANGSTFSFGKAPAPTGQQQQ